MPALVPANGRFSLTVNLGGALLPVPQGPPGKGVPPGGDTGQVLAKASGDDYDTEWRTLPSGGGGSGEAPYVVTAMVTSGSSSATVSDTRDNIKAKLDANIPVVGYIIVDSELVLEASVSWGGASIEMVATMRDNSGNRTWYGTVSLGGTGTTGYYSGKNVSDGVTSEYVDGKAPYVVTASGDAANANYAQIADAVEAGRAVFLKYTGDGQTTEYLPLTFLITTSKFAVFTCYEFGYLYVYSVSSTGSFDRTGKKVLGEDDVTSMISSAISGVYTPKGTIAFASLPTASAGNLGWVYNISDAFTTTAAFVEGAGHSYGAGTNVVCVDAGSSSYKWDVLAGTIDLEEMTAAEVQTIWGSI